MSSNIIFHDRSFNDGPTTELMTDNDSELQEVKLVDSAPELSPKKRTRSKKKKKKKSKQGFCEWCCSPIRGVACCVICTIALEAAIPVLLAFLCLDKATHTASDTESDMEGAGEEEEDQSVVSGKLKEVTAEQELGQSHGGRGDDFTSTQ